MIAEQYTFNINNIGGKNIYTYDIPSEIMVQPFTHIAIKDVIFPKTQNQIDQQSFSRPGNHREPAI